WRIRSVVENSWNTFRCSIAWAPFGVVARQGRNDLCEIWERHDQDTDVLVGVYVGFWRGFFLQIKLTEAWRMVGFVLFCWSCKVLAFLSANWKSQVIT